MVFISSRSHDNRHVKIGQVNQENDDDDDDDEFRFNDASTHLGHLRQNGTLVL